MNSSSSFAVVVNDDPTQLNVLCGLVRKAGLEPHAFTGAEAALAAMSGGAGTVDGAPGALPALVVTDLYMPGIDGFRFCRLLRSPEYAACNEIPILVVSATLAGDETDRIAAELGADAFLPSPVDGQRFVEQVRAILRGEQLRPSMRVLIVEDSTTLAGILAKAFAAHGFQADTAFTARAAADAFTTTAYNLAVLDYHLPDGKGDALLDAFRAERPDCVCVMITTDPGPELALDWMKRGAAAYLRKPFEPDYLIELCAKARRERALLRVQDLLEVRTNELRESEALFSLFMRHSPIYTYIKVATPTESRVLHASDCFQQMIGISGVDMVGKTMAELFPADMAAKMTADDWAVVTNGEVLTLDEDLNGRNFTSIKFPIVHGDRTLLAGYTIDITDRKRAEEALRLSEDKFAKAFHCSPDAILITRVSDGHVVEVNEGFTTLSGFERDEALGGSTIALDLWAEPDDRERCIAAIQRDGRVSGMEVGFRARSGAVLQCTVSGALIDMDGEPHILSVVRDVTEQKRAKAALVDLFENAPVAYHELDRDGVVHRVNAAECALLGYQADEVLGRPVWDLVAETERQASREAVGRKLSGAQPLAPFRRRFVRSDGTELLLEIHDRLVRNETGEIQGIRTAAIDVTEAARVEEDKRSLEERLQRAEKMEALGTLAGGVAHDLNNVLGIVVGYSEMLLDEVGKASPLRRSLETVMSGGLKAAAIVDDLLTLARRGVPGRSIINVNTIVTDCQKSQEFANLSLHHPSVTITTDLEPDLLNISGSSVHLTKSLFNLVSNASEAMAKGGMVTIETAHQYLDKPIQGYDQIREGDYVVLSVSDTGEGIRTADLKRIFEPFYTKKVMGRSGTGLGLAVVWGTVKDHHGYVNVQSEEGKGSTFTLYFPVTREDITAEAGAVALSEYMGHGESLLVVDDVAQQRELAAGLLTSLNYQVSSVSSGEEAVAHVNAHEVDLIILDMIMDSGMDGLDTYRSIVKIRPKQRAIIVSGFSESDRVRAAKGLGAGAYVRKPYIKEKLGLAVRQELDRAE